MIYACHGSYVLPQCHIVTQQLFCKNKDYTVFDNKYKLCSTEMQCICTAV